MSAGAGWCFRHEMKEQPRSDGGWRCTLCEAEREPHGVARAIEEAEECLARLQCVRHYGQPTRAEKVIRSLLAALREAEEYEAIVGELLSMSNEEARATADRLCILNALMDAQERALRRPTPEDPGGDGE